jgi:hypothetical protein
MILYYLLLATLAHAVPPPALCIGQECTGKIAALAEAFNQAGPLRGDIYLGSGECYHLSPDYNSTVTHYGFGLIDRAGDGLFFDGSFGFFFPQNPYADLTLETARARAVHRFEPNHRLEIHPDYAFVDMNPGGQEIYRYWLRQAGQSVYLEGAWGTSHALFCQFERQ